MPLTGYEGNPSGHPPDWGTLIARQRNMTQHPLKGLYGDDGEPVAAGLLFESCTAVAARMRVIVQRINAAHMLYAPIPELQWNTVNSNSFAYWALGRLGVHQPAPPAGAQALRIHREYTLISQGSWSRTDFSTWQRLQLLRNAVIG